MTEYLVLHTDATAGTISLRYALAVAIAFAHEYPDADGDALAAHIGAVAASTRWGELGETWRVVPDADELSGFRLPGIAREILRLIRVTREAGYDLADHDVRETLYAALTERLAREDAERRAEMPAFLSPAQLAETLGVDPALVEGDTVGVLAVLNDEPIPEGLPEAIRRVIVEGRRRDGWDELGRRVAPGGDRGEA